MAQSILTLSASTDPSTVLSLTANANTPSRSLANKKTNIVTINTDNALSPITPGAIRLVTSIPPSPNVRQIPYDYCDAYVFNPTLYNSQTTTSFSRISEAQLNAIIKDNKLYAIQKLIPSAPTTSFGVYALFNPSTDLPTVWNSKNLINLPQGSSIVYQILCGFNADPTTIYTTTTFQYQITAEEKKKNLLDKIATLNATQFSIDSENKVTGFFLTPSGTKDTSLTIFTSKSNVLLNRVSIYFVVNDKDEFTANLSSLFPNGFTAYAINLPISESDYIHFYIQYDVVDRSITGGQNNAKTFKSPMFSFSNQRIKNDQSLALPVNTLLLTSNVTHPELIMRTMQHGTASTASSTKIPVTLSSVPSKKCIQCIGDCKMLSLSATLADIEQCWRNCCPNVNTDGTTDVNNIVGLLNSLLILNPTLSSSYMIFPMTEKRNVVNPSNILNIKTLITSSSTTPSSSSIMRTMQIPSTPSLPAVGVRDSSIIVPQTLIGQAPPAPTLPSAPTSTSFTNSSSSIPSSLPIAPSFNITAPTTPSVPSPILLSTNPAVATGNPSFPGPSAILPSQPTSIQSTTTTPTSTPQFENLIIPLITTTTQPSTTTVPMLPTLASPAEKPTNVLQPSAAPHTVHTQQLSLDSLSGLTGMAQGFGQMGGAAITDGFTSNLGGLLDQYSFTNLNPTLSSLPSEVKDTVCISSACLAKCSEYSTPIAGVIGSGASQAKADGVPEPPDLPKIPSSLPSIPTGAISMGPNSPPPTQFLDSSIVPGALNPSNIPQPVPPSNGVPLESFKDPDFLRAAMPGMMNQAGLMASNFTATMDSTSNMSQCASSCYDMCKAGVKPSTQDCTGEKKNTMACIGQTFDTNADDQKQLGTSMNGVANNAQSVIDNVIGAVKPKPPSFTPFSLVQSTNNVRTFQVVSNTSPAVTSSVTPAPAIFVSPTFFPSSNTPQQEDPVQFLSLNDMIMNPLPLNTPQLIKQQLFDYADTITIDMNLRAFNIAILLEASVDTIFTAIPLEQFNREVSFALSHPSEYLEMYANQEIDPEDPSMMYYGTDFPADSFILLAHRSSARNAIHTMSVLQLDSHQSSNTNGPIQPSLKGSPLKDKLDAVRSIANGNFDYTPYLVQNDNNTN